MRAFAIVLLVACGGGSSAPGKDEVTCGASWDRTPPVAGTCDEACAEMMTGTGSSCGTGIQHSSGEVVCQTTFEFEGERGCCFDLGMEGRVSGQTEPSRMRRVFFLSCK